MFVMESMLFRDLKRKNPIECVCVCIEKEIYFKELAPRVVQPNKFKICKGIWQVGGPGQSQSCHSSLKATCVDPSLAQGRSVFCSIHAFN